MFQLFKYRWLPIHLYPHTRQPLPKHPRTNFRIDTYTKIPTKTSLPTNTAQPAPRKNGALWFEDDCTSIDVGRALFGLDYMNFAVSNGQCHITANSNGNVLPVMYAYPPLDDIAIELDLDIDVCNPKSVYSIIFHSDEEISDGLNYYYRLTLNPTEKLVSIALWKNNQWMIVGQQKLQEEPLVPGKTTHVRLEVLGNQFRVYLSGNFVFEAFDDQITVPGIFGVAISSYSAPETLHYDNLKVYALAP